MGIKNPVAARASFDRSAGPKALRRKLGIDPIGVLGYDFLEAVSCEKEFWQGHL